MKLFGFYITRTNWGKAYNDLREERRQSWLDLITANKGMAQEIEKLERQLERYKRKRGDDGRFVKSTVQSETTAALRQYANKVDASYDEVKKIAGFGA